MLSHVIIVNYYQGPWALMSSAFRSNILDNAFQAHNSFHITYT